MMSDQPHRLTPFLIKEAHQVRRLLLAELASSADDTSEEAVARRASTMSLLERIDRLLERGRQPKDQPHA
jgi:hypothetical protein